MSRFKVGDMVKVLSGRNCEDYICGWSRFMNEFVGNVYEIRDVCSDGSVHLHGCYGYHFDDRFLELVETSEFMLSTIDKVIVNDPATIIIWKDGTKTVVKCGDNDIFDAEKGIAMAIVKRLLFNNKSTKMNKWFKSQIPDDDVIMKTTITCYTLDDFYDTIRKVNDVLTK